MFYAVLLICSTSACLPIEGREAHETREACEAEARGLAIQAQAAGLVAQFRATHGPGRIALVCDTLETMHEHGLFTHIPREADA